MKKILALIVLSMFIGSISAQVTFEKEILISDKGLFFDGQDVEPNTPDRGEKYDFIFGSRITPHGDCIKEYDGFVFMTWYRGGKYDRHVMLSRYNTKTGVTKTIEFPHQHNGFQNTPHLGESHNTIAVGICPLDGTIHMLYDMHAYDENKPSDGSLANDYFRYSYSKKNAATVADADFTINQFVNSPSGNYKHLKMRNGTNYKSLTYPNFFTNTRGELFMWIREGGNNNGAYKFCKYDGNSWSDFTQFNVLNAKSKGAAYNWGLYGDIKFESGKMRIGFSTRYSNNNDIYKYNNGFHYAYSDDPNGLNQWKDHKGTGLTLPLIDPNKIKVAEPGDEVTANGANSVVINTGTDWTVTERGDLHFVTAVKSGSQQKNVHTYKRAGSNNFITATNFPGGNLYTYNNEVYLIGLEGGRVFVEKADGGTNNWSRIYTGPTSGKRFRHGNVYITNGKIYFYMMEDKSGSAQPIYLQILDLGLDLGTATNKAPLVTVTAPANNATYTIGDTITLKATASDADGTIAKVNFKIDDAFYRTDNASPYETTLIPTAVGTYKIAARAFDNENAQTETFILINVVGLNKNPVVQITSPTSDAVFTLGQTINLAATASDADGSIVKVNFKIDDLFYRLDNSSPFETTFTPTQVGTYKIAARAFDDKDAQTETTVYVTVVGPNRAPEGAFLEPLSDTILLGYSQLRIEVEAQDPDGDDISLTLKIDGKTIRTERVEPYEWGHISANPATELETVGLSAGTHLLEVIMTDSKGLSRTISKTLYVAPITALHNDEKVSLTIFPNPTTGQIFFSRTAQWEIHSILGEFLLSGEGVVVDLSTYPKGMYLLKTSETTTRIVHQ